MPLGDEVPPDEDVPDGDAAAGDFESDFVSDFDSLFDSVFSVDVAGLDVPFLSASMPFFRAADG